MSNCNAQENFQHSEKTITNYFHQVLFRLVKMQGHLLDLEMPVYRQIANNKKFAFQFDDCLEALDSTHIIILSLL